MRSTCNFQFYYYSTETMEKKRVILTFMDIVLSQNATELLMRINSHSVVMHDHTPYANCAEAVIPMKKPNILFRTSRMIMLLCCWPGLSFSGNSTAPGF